jgi:hypothetical protein
MSIVLSGAQRQTYWELRASLAREARHRFETKKCEADKQQKVSISLLYRSSVAVNSPDLF